MFSWFSFIFAIGFTIIHYSTKYIHSIRGIPRSYFLSISGGIAVSYVFVHLLPELSNHQTIIEDAVDKKGFNFIKNHAYLVAISGLAIFYGLEKMVKNPKNKNNTPGNDVFWVHVTSFFIYNALIGYLLIREHFVNTWDMFFYFIAFSVHFITNDHSLREEHSNTYDRYGRWLLSAAILLGWFIGLVTKINELVISVLISFLAGGIVLNVLKEELPKERESSFVAFLIGIIVYSILLLLI